MLDVAYSYDVITGRLGPRLPLVGSDSWSIELNKGTSFSVTLDSDRLRLLDRRRWAFPWAGVVLGWTRPDGSVYLVEGGPVSDAPSYDIKAKTTTLPFATHHEILAQRIVRGDVDFRPGDEGALVTAHATASRLSLGSIMERVLAWAQVGPNGALPFEVDPALWQVADDNADHRRDYLGYNLANNDATKLLTELSNVIGGPDFTFQPRLSADGLYVQWWFMHGLEGQPSIPTSRPWVFDTTTKDSPVSTYVVHLSDRARVTRAYATGDGEGEGLAVRIAENAGQMQGGAPLRERVSAYSSVITPEVLQAHADADVHAGDRTAVQIDLTVDGDDLTQPFGTYQLGETGRFILAGHPDYPDGEHWLKITKISGQIGSQMLTLSLQEAHQ